MDKEKFYLKVYIDSSFFSDNKESYCCYYLDGFFTEESKNYSVFSLGTIKNSAFCEYLGVEKSLQKILSILNKSGISHYKTEIEIFTDLQVLPRQYKKWIPPPKNQVIIDSFNRICMILKKFKKAEIFWVERGKNPAGKILEKHIETKKEIKLKENSSKTYFREIINFL